MLTLWLETRNSGRHRSSLTMPLPTFPNVAENCFFQKIYNEEKICKLVEGVDPIFVLTYGIVHALYRLSARS